MRRKYVLILVIVVAFVGLRWVQETSARQGAGAGGDETEEFLCYDANKDGQVDISDPVRILSWLFIGGPPPTACAQNCAEFCGFSEGEVARLKELLAAEGEREFGRRLAGTWFGGVGEEPLVQVLSLTADGSVVDIGDTDISGNFLELGSIGKWEVIDRETRQVSLTLLAFYHNPETREYTGLSMITTRNATVNEDFTRITGLRTEVGYYAERVGHAEWPQVLAAPPDEVLQDDQPFVMERLP